VFDWFSRYSQRQRDLAAGADADLVQSNRRKWKLTGALFCLASLIVGIEKWATPNGVLKEILMWFSGLLYLGAVFLAQWAWQEQAFLDKPDPKKPPSFFK
jgi:4-hydroxybenzoate polyprenyltransferase